MEIISHNQNKKKSKNVTNTDTEILPGPSDTAEPDREALVSLSAAVITPEMKRP